MQSRDFRLELCGYGVGRYSIMGSWGIEATDHGEIKRMDYDNLTSDESPLWMSITNISANQPMMKQGISEFSSKLQKFCFLFNSHAYIRLSLCNNM